MIFMDTRRGRGNTPAWIPRTVPGAAGGPTANRPAIYWAAQVRRDPGGRLAGRGRTSHRPRL